MCFIGRSAKCRHLFPALCLWLKWEIENFSCSEMFSLHQKYYPVEDSMEKKGVGLDFIFLCWPHTASQVVLRVFETQDDEGVFKQPLLLRSSLKLSVWKEEQAILFVNDIKSSQREVSVSLILVVKSSMVEDRPKALLYLHRVSTCLHGIPRVLRRVPLFNTYAGELIPDTQPKIRSAIFGGLKVFYLSRPTLQRIESETATFKSLRPHWHELHHNFFARQQEYGTWRLIAPHGIEALAKKKKKMLKA